jgi:hypothetical protein
LGEIRSSHKVSLHFLERMIDIPQVDLLACALLVNSKFDHTVLTDIEAPTTSHSLLRWTTFSTNTSAVSKARAAAGGDRDAQILLGELPENLDWVDVSIHIGTHFLTYESFMTLLANITGILGSQYSCTILHLDSPTNPLMFRFTHKVAFKLSSDDSHTWLMLNQGQACHVFCWWVSILDQFTRLCTSLAKNPKYVLFFGEGRFHELPVAGHLEALGILNDAVTCYCKIIQNVEAVPVMAIATAWEASRT